MVNNILLFLLAFIFLWIGSGLAVSAVTKIAHSLRMSSFFISFFVLGLFSSLTEIMVGINAVISQTPEIFVGNLIGSSVVVFLLVIPLLAVVGNGVSLKHSFKHNDLITAVIVVGLPALLAMNNQLSLIDAILCVVLYVYFVYTQERRTGYFERLVILNFGRGSMYSSIGKILVGVILIFSASNILVSQIPILGAAFGISPFVISVLIISIGTNIPEISIAIRAVMANKKDIAFGNYIGSASLNTLEMGILTLISKTPVIANGSNFSALTFILGLGAFLYFARSKNTISRFEGLSMLLFYVFFVVLELITGPGWSI